VHATNSSNLLVSTFVAEFEDAVSMTTVPYTITPLTVGYPNPTVRRVDLVVTEPNITVVKEACNETLSIANFGAGAAGENCNGWATAINNGDTNDNYVYRITLTNEAASGGYTRAPAYNVVVTDDLDPTDLVQIVSSGTNTVAPFQNDNLDNDNDGSTDEVDEGAISDNIVNNFNPARITFSHTHSTALERIDPGDSVTLYYRVDMYDDVVAEQILRNTVNVTYDSLEGDYGSMTDPPLRPNGDIAGARVYTTTPVQSTVQIIGVQTQPKRIIDLSNTAPGGPPQPLTIGEEVQYELVTEIPVSHLDNIVIRDDLPDGMRCVEAPNLDLRPGGPHDSAGFVPGGLIIPTCTSTGTNDYVEWNLGSQELTTTTGTRYNLPVTFIARVENTGVTDNGVPLNNGLAPSTATVSFVDANGPQTLSFTGVQAVVSEPDITLTKTFSAATTDAGDVLTVTITATNNGAVPAYNVIQMRAPGQPFHPKGVGNGYVISFDDKKVYVAGPLQGIWIGESPFRSKDI